MFSTMPDDGKLDTESDSGEFWVLFGGFAPIGKKVASEDDITAETTPPKLYRYFLFCKFRIQLLESCNNTIVCFIESECCQIIKSLLFILS